MDFIFAEFDVSLCENEVHLGGEYVLFIGSYYIMDSAKGGVAYGRTGGRRDNDNGHEIQWPGCRERSELRSGGWPKLRPHHRGVDPRFDVPGSGQRMFKCAFFLEGGWAEYSQQGPPVSGKLTLSCIWGAGVELKTLAVAPSAKTATATDTVGGKSQPASIAAGVIAFTGGLTLAEGPLRNIWWGTGLGGGVTSGVTSGGMPAPAPPPPPHACMHADKPPTVLSFGKLKAYNPGYSCQSIFTCTSLYLNLLIYLLIVSVNGVYWRSAT